MGREKGHNVSTRTREKIRKTLLGRKLSDNAYSKLAIAKRIKTRESNTSDCRTTVVNRVKRAFGNKCAICGWKESGCDGHHIISMKDGGENISKNIIILCPNHHRLADRGNITIKELQTIRSRIL